MKNYGNWATSDTFDSDKVLIKEVGVQFLNGLDHQLTEQLLVSIKELGVEGSLGALQKHVSAGKMVIAVDLDLEVFQFF